MRYTGLPVSAGRTFAKSLVLRPLPDFQLDKKADRPAREGEKRLEEALWAVLLEFAAARNAPGLQPERAALLEVQEAMLEDAGYQGDIRRYIRQGCAPESAALLAAKTQEELLLSLNDPVMASRAEDLRDASLRLACRVTGVRYPDLRGLTEPVVVIARDIGPSLLAGADLSLVRGLATELGSRTSHVSILAAGLGIPALVRCDGVTDIPDGAAVYLDGESGELISQPDGEEAGRLRLLAGAYAEERAALLAYSPLPAVTADGVNCKVYLNIADPATLSKVAEYGLDGAGLFRTEFLYLNRTHPPTEEEQLAVYANAARRLAGKPLTIRTMDLGADKPVPWLKLPPEENPALGYRAIRIGLSRRELLLPQLRAILRSAAHGEVRLLFPMVATAEELDALLLALDEAKRELLEEGAPHDPDVPVGIMVEVPSAALLLDRLIGRLSFVSIGSNDLIQYTLAADRLNGEVAYLQNGLDPAVLSLIRRVIEVCGTSGAECSLCGELAGEPLGLAALLALGLRRFSVSPSLSLATKRRLSLLSSSVLSAAGERMLKARGAKEAEELLREALPGDYLSLL